MKKFMSIFMALVVSLSVMFGSPSIISAENSQKNVVYLGKDIKRTCARNQGVATDETVNPVFSGYRAFTNDDFLYACRYQAFDAEGKVIPNSDIKITGLDVVNQDIEKKYSLFNDSGKDSLDYTVTMTTPDGRVSSIKVTLKRGGDRAQAETGMLALKATDVVYYVENGPLTWDQLRSSLMANIYGYYTNIPTNTYYQTHPPVTKAVQYYLDVLNQAINSKTLGTYQQYALWDFDATNLFVTVQPFNVTLKSLNQETPIDLLVDDGSGNTYINGPRQADVGDTIKYSASIDLSSIANIASSFGDSMGFISGTFTITLQTDSGVVPETGFGTSSDINDYFAGGGVKMFELVNAPTYDANNHLITFKVKVKDEYATTGIKGNDCAAILNEGISGNTNYTAITTDNLKTLGYSRAKAAFEGTLNFHNTDNSKNFTFTLTGVQADPANLSDPTLTTLGNDPTTTVSATVVYQNPVPNTGNVQNPWLYLGIVVVFMSITIILNRKRNKCN